MIILSLFSIIIINNYFSAKLTAKMNAKTNVDRINSLDDLFDSHLNLVVPCSFLNTMKALNNNYFINKFTKRSQFSKTILNGYQIINEEKWVKGVVKGESAIFFYEVPTKKALVNFLSDYKSDINLKFLDNDFGYSVLTIASNRRLDKEFRDYLNFRYLLISFCLIKYILIIFY